MTKGRPSKTTVDFFPHQTTHKKTIFTLENLYGNDGYAFWFKLLEILGSTENHVFRYEKPADWLFLVAKTRVTEEKALSILKTLADLGAIDPDLHREKTVWCENFVRGLLPVYVKRSTKSPGKPTLRGEKGLYGEKKQQSRVEESRVEKRREKPLSDYSEKFELFWSAYPNKKGKYDSFRHWKKHNCENELFDELMKSLSLQKKSREWKQENGKYIPAGSTWVNGKRWEDILEPAKTGDNHNGFDSKDYQSGATPDEDMPEYLRPTGD